MKSLSCVVSPILNMDCFNSVVALLIMDLASSAKSPWSLQAGHCRAISEVATDCLLESELNPM